MSNQYNTPLTVQHKNNYQGMPLEAMEAALQARQRSYDNIENIGLQTKSYLGGIEGYGEYADSYLNGKKKELDDFVSQYDRQDLTNPEISRAFKQKAQEVSDDEKIADIQKSATLIKQFRSNLSDLRKSGDLYDENVYSHLKAIDRYSKTGEFGGTFDPSIEKGVNIEEEAEKYYKALHADGAEYIRKVADGEGGSLYYSESSSGVSGNKVQQQAARMFGEFSKSQAGKQLARRYEMEAGNKATEQGKQQYMARTFLNAGRGFEYSDTKSNMSAALDKKEDLKRKKKEESATLEVPFVEAASPADHIPLDENGLPVGSGGLWEVFGRVHKESGSTKDAFKAGWDYILNGKKGTEFTEAEKKKFLPAYDALEVINKDRRKNKQKELTPQEYFPARHNHSETKRQLISNIPLDSKTIKAYEDGLIGTDKGGGAILALPAIDPANPGDRNQTVGSVLKKLMGKSDKDEITPDDLKDHNIQLSGIPAKSGYTPRGLNIFVDGKPIIADMGYHMLSGGYKPKDAQEAQQLNEFNQAQAELKGGSHIFTGYVLGGKDGKQILSKRVKVVYDPTTGQSILKEVN